MPNIDWSALICVCPVIAFILLIVAGLCKISGDIDQWEEDNLGVRRS